MGRSSGGPLAGLTYPWRRDRAQPCPRPTQEWFDEWQDAANETAADQNRVLAGAVCPVLKQPPGFGRDIRLLEFSPDLYELANLADEFVLLQPIPGPLVVELQL